MVFNPLAKVYITSWKDPPRKFEWENSRTWGISGPWLQVRKLLVTSRGEGLYFSPELEGGVREIELHSYISSQESEERPGMKDGSQFSQKLVIKPTDMGRNGSENGLYLQRMGVCLWGKRSYTPMNSIGFIGYLQTNLHDTIGVTHHDRWPVKQLQQLPLSSAVLMYEPSFCFGYWVQL